MRELSQPLSKRQNRIKYWEISQLGKKNELCVEKCNIVVEWRFVLAVNKIMT